MRVRYRPLPLEFTSIQPWAVEAHGWPATYMSVDTPPRIRYDSSYRSEEFSGTELHVSTSDRDTELAPEAGEVANVRFTQTFDVQDSSWKYEDVLANENGAEIEAFNRYNAPVVTSSRKTNTSSKNSVTSIEQA